MNFERLNELFSIYNKPISYNPSYGTAGFRTKSINLDSTVFRCGILMGLKSIITNENCGIMITASHNEESDNGVKLINSDGEMIDKEWEYYATLFACTNSIHELTTYIYYILDNYQLKSNITSKVIIGIDTRDSGHKLANICMDGIQLCGIEPLMMGQVTTPELHFYTVMSNKFNTIPNYCINLVHNFKLLVNNEHLLNSVLHVDCANGVGAIKLMQIKEDLENLGLSLVLYNNGNGILNHKCGADFVEKNCEFPLNMDTIPEYTKCCSFDGDADRIVYFTKINGCFKLLNGDKIACLFTSYIYNNILSSNNNNISIGCIQTAYANGASSKYITKSMPNVDIVCTDTGVQYLHNKAKDYDIGVYFEANGHGTVLFKEHLTKNVKINLISNLLSQYTGDAIGNMLFIEFILRTINFKDWITMYSDLYTKQVSISIDKSLFSTTNYGRTCVKPSGLQENIDTIVMKYSNARAFVRPSGTEDIVRLYVEGSTLNDINNMSSEIIKSIYTYVK
jgi:phosphoacetylglucosamine mutase